VSEHVFRYRELRYAGISRRRIERVADGGGVVHLSRGVYGNGPGGAIQEIRAVLARMPAGTVLGFETAAIMYGLGSALGRRSGIDDGVHVIVPPGLARPRIRGVVCHEAAAPVRSAVLIGGIPCAPPERCAIDLARTLRRFDALAVLDGMLRITACTSADLHAELARHAGLRGVISARELVGIADGRAECPQESHLRLILIDAHLPVPEPQVWVRDSTGRPVYRIDLGYSEQKVGLEYDGRSHLTTARLGADRSRMNWLSARGWTMRYFTARDVYGSPIVVVATVRAALDL
jgi:hypothetical protein